MALGYVLSGQGAAQVLPDLYFMLALLALFRLGRICGLDRFSALAGVLFAVSIPTLHWSGGSGKNDFALTFFILSSVLAYLRWMGTRNFRWILLGAFFLAMAAGVKHIVLFAVPPMGLLYAYAASRQARPVLAFGKLLAVLAGFGLFWHARAWLATGNPLYPSQAASAAQSASGHSSTLWHDVILPYLQLPWSLHFHGRSHFESVSDYPMGIVLVVFAPVWLLARERLASEAKVCLFFCAMYLSYWGYTVPMIRYAAAPIAIVPLLTAGLLVGFCRTAPRLVGGPALIVGAYAFLFSICGIAINEINGPQLRYFSGRIDRQEYLREALLPYRAMEFLKGAAQPGDSIFSFENCGMAYSPNEDHFDCMMTNPEGWNQAVEWFSTHSYRFLIVPQAHAGEVPPGWEVAYKDSAFHVYRNATLAR
jgi:4-amino-4-deoxy-L-arabinose transferase-like glycosyltransferase